MAVLEVTRVTDVTAEAEIQDAHELPGTAGRRWRFTTTVDVPDDRRPFVVEVRTVAAGTFSYQVDGVVIERLRPAP